LLPTSYEKQAFYSSFQKEPKLKAPICTPFFPQPSPSQPLESSSIPIASNSSIKQTSTLPKPDWTTSFPTPTDPVVSPQLLTSAVPPQGPTFVSYAPNTSALIQSPILRNCTSPSHYTDTRAQPNLLQGQTGMTHEVSGL